MSDTGLPMHDDPTVNITDSAREELKRLMGEYGEGELGLRLAVEPGGCAGYQYGLGFEKAAGETDRVLESNGLRIYVHAAFADLIDGISIDYQNDLLGSGFRIDNPNATGGCGCGKSFAA